MLSRFQIGFIIIFTGLFFTLLFGLDTKPRKHKLIETSRASEQENVKAEEFVTRAKVQLNGEELKQVETLEASAKEDAENPAILTESYKGLAGLWFKLGFPTVSGIYAEKIADLQQDDEKCVVHSRYNFYTSFKKQP